MKIAFVGLGSIAKRHIANLAEILAERGIAHTIDVFRHRTDVAEDPKLGGLLSGVYHESELAQHRYDIIFITNPTSLHFETVKRCAKQTKHLFIEKPVFDRTDVDPSELGLQDDTVAYVACPLRYTAVLQYIKANVDLDAVYAARAISSSYLPDWRPGVDYRTTYSARKELGGGVAIDLIHEWDYLTSFFGFPERVYGIEKRVSQLEITSNDIAVYIGTYPSKVVELHLDYFGRKTVRELLLFTKEDTIRADLVGHRVIYERSGKIVTFDEERNTFQKRELCHFLDIIDGKAKNDSDITHALRVLQLASSAEEQ